jgi:hypothetical protein
VQRIANDHTTWSGQTDSPSGRAPKPTPDWRDGPSSVTL